MSFNDRTVRKNVDHAESVVTQVSEVFILSLIVSVPLFQAVSVKEEPLPLRTLFLYHWYVGEAPPLVGIAVNVDGVFLSTDGLPEIKTVGVTLEFTLIDSEFDVTDAGEAQTAVELMTHVTASPLLIDEVVQTLDVAPEMFEPFLLHWYVGVPPFTGAAVKVMFDPAQRLLADLVIDTDGVTLFAYNCTSATCIEFAKPKLQMFGKIMRYQEYDVEFEKVKDRDKNRVLLQGIDPDAIDVHDVPLLLPSIV